MAEEWWGNHLVREQLEEAGLIDMLDPQAYLDNQQTDKSFPTLVEEVTLEAEDKYIQASIMIPRGNTFACRTIVSRKCNAKGKIIRHAHDNCILDSWIDDVEFANCKVTALTANAIAKAMYAQCDPDVNEYILWDKLVDLKRTDNALTLDQQQIIVIGTTQHQKSTKVYKVLVHLL